MHSKKFFVYNLNSKATRTVSIVVSSSGTMVPFQFIYANKMKNNLSISAEFQHGFDLFFNEKHWENEVAPFYLFYLFKMIFSYKII